MFADFAWQTPAAIAAGLAVMGVILFVGLRSRQSEPAKKTDGEKPAAAPPPKLVSRIVSWTSMIQRGGYRGKTKSLHRSGGSVDVFITDEARGDNAVRSWVAERSVNTLTLVAEESFSAGSIAKVRPVNAPDGIPWIDINIHECSPHEHEWKIVCRFVKVPPYNILMLFG
jgi:hypothetical protein